MNSKLLIFLVALVTSLHSCSKDPVDDERTSVEVNLLGIEMSTTESDTQNRAATSVASTESKVLPLGTIAFNQDFGVSISLSSDQSDDGLPINPNFSTSARAAGVTQSGPQTWILDNGIKYRLLVYNEAKNLVVDTVYTVGQNIGSGLLLNSGQSYTFIAYSIISKTEVPPAPAGKLNEATFTSISGDTDFIYFSETRKLNSGKNELKILMKHTFSQITTNINSALIGTISKVVARVEDHYLSPTISLATGVVINYNNKEIGGRKLVFAQTANTKSSNLPAIICNSGDTNSTLVFDEITINNITKKSLTIPGLQLQPGRRYVLTLDLKSFTADTDPTIELGNASYAPGNLIYNHQTNTYSFAKDGFGDYWFKNYVKSRRTDLDTKEWGVNNQRPRTQLNGGSGDPCALISPLNAWRLPNRSEMENIKSATEAQIARHPGPNIYAPVRNIEENFKGTGRSGMYFGTQKNPGSDANKYLFISFEGVYNDNQNPNDVNTTGWYMLKSGDRYEMMQIGPNIYTFNFYDLPDNTAVSIRCVKRM